MSYQSKIKRYAIIIKSIEKDKYPSFNRILEKINEEGIKLGNRQLQRDFESLRTEFGFEIKYDIYKNGYYSDENTEHFPYFIKLIEFSQNAEMLINNLKDGKSFTEIIEFEQYNTLKGIEFLKDFVFAIKNNRIVTLSYKRFDSNESKTHKLYPYLLREYLNRWYIIGINADKNDVITFGLDRIESFSIENETFEPKQKEHIKELFENYIGINAIENAKIENIEIKCEPFLGKLLLTLPLHPSQHTLKESDNEIIISLHISINFELRQRLLMMSSQSAVIKPEHLKNDIQQMIEKAKNNYK